MLYLTHSLLAINFNQLIINNMNDMNSDVVHGLAPQHGIIPMDNLS